MISNAQQQVLVKYGEFIGSVKHLKHTNIESKTLVQDVQDVAKALQVLINTINEPKLIVPVVILSDTVHTAIRKLHWCWGLLIELVKSSSKEQDQPQNSCKQVLVSAIQANLARHGQLMVHTKRLHSEWKKKHPSVFLALAVLRQACHPRFDGVRRDRLTEGVHMLVKAIPALQDHFKQSDTLTETTFQDIMLHVEQHYSITEHKSISFQAVSQSSEKKQVQQESNQCTWHADGRTVKMVDGVCPECHACFICMKQIDDPMGKIHLNGCFKRNVSKR